MGDAELAAPTSTPESSPTTATFLPSPPCWSESLLAPVTSEASSMTPVVPQRRTSLSVTASRAKISATNLTALSASSRSALRGATRAAGSVRSSRLETTRPRRSRGIGSGSRGWPTLCSSSADSRPTSDGHSFGGYPASPTAAARGRCTRRAGGETAAPVQGWAFPLISAIRVPLMN
jgi:hypothetical protein